jgi:hypothetical protein
MSNVDYVVIVVDLGFMLSLGPIYKNLKQDCQ